MSDHPIKTRELHNHHFDSTKWNNFPVRDDDIIIATAYKSGTTWMQNIVMGLVYQQKQIPENCAELFPWLDLRVPPIHVQLPVLEAITERRQIKTHLRLDALVFNEKAKYIYIGRDGRDCYMSLCNHYRSGNDLWYQLLNETPGLVGEKLPRWSEAGWTEESLFDEWISRGQGIEGETDGYPFWSLFDNVRSWWEYRHLPNIFFVHFQDLLDDLPGTVRDIAAFLDIPIHEDGFDDMIESFRFSTMKKNADTSALIPVGGAIFEGGGKTFINKGTNGRWKGVLTPEQLRKYDEVVAAKLDPDCAAWLAGGEAAFPLRRNA
mmetsp:Transcript_1875/g.2983  ORF Transcript_1875/g.2983 Transcript_1875/m.2983 type:complete len:320 (-) Transcript_1875:198-1157(-)|eukprot:CAMPEP_0185018336 /NCGR_PEP_ID=MMETSP1103-20130426/1095_1 /TAXON_ID=36769 /ORGANISM="Paraphysomonas bandaiensis, Strain Caron Lab Isolate" /LENGTH=319 /DNA_ID=CAMNT_0027548115 /DNA_START=30 /DNA_END=989 /DNA_ORIENTATION=+